MCSGLYYTLMGYNKFYQALVGIVPACIWNYPPCPRTVVLCSQAMVLHKCWSMLGCSGQYCTIPLLLGLSLTLCNTFTGVTDDTNEDSVPFWSNRVRVLLLCMFLYRCVTLRVYKWNQTDPYRSVWFHLYHLRVMGVH